MCTHIDFDYKIVYSFSNIQYNSIHFFLISDVYELNLLKLLCMILFIPK